MRPVERGSRRPEHPTAWRRRRLVDVAVAITLASSSLHAGDARRARLVPATLIVHPILPLAGP